MLWYPQAPRNIYLTDSSLSSWLDIIRPEIGSSAGNLLDLGLLTISRTIWFRILLAGTALTLLVRLADAVQATFGFPELGDYTKTGTAADDAESLLQITKSWLGKNYRINKCENEEGKEIGLEAIRPLGSIGSLCIAIGGLVFLAGWIWSDIGGWAYPGIRLTNNMTVGSPDGKTSLTWVSSSEDWAELQNSTQVDGNIHAIQGDISSSGELGSTRGWHWRGVDYRLDSIGPAVHAEGQDSNGNPLALQTTAGQSPSDELTLSLSMIDDLKSFASLDKGIVIQLGLEQVDGKPQVRVRAYQGQEGELITNQLIDQSITLEINNSVFMLSVIPYAQITAIYSPGKPLMIIGLVIALAGVILSVTYRPRHMRLTVIDQHELLQVTLQTSQVKDAAWLDSLADYLGMKCEGNNDE